MKYLGLWITLASIAILGAIVGLSSFKIVDAHEFCYIYDLRNGSLTAPVTTDGKYKTGLIWKVPFLEKVHTIDLRPKQVCIGSQSGRVLNCKLIKFNPDGFVTFVEWHGRRDYDYVYSQSQHPDDFKEIMKN